MLDNRDPILKRMVQNVGLIGKKCQRAINSQKYGRYKLQVERRPILW